VNAPNDAGSHPGAPADAGSAAAARDVPAGPAARKGSRLWLWFVAAFLVQLGAWATWLVIASRHPVQEVPLVRSR
jgi:hypothetical protein